MVNTDNNRPTEIAFCLFVRASDYNPLAPSDTRESRDQDRSARSKNRVPASDRYGSPGSLREDLRDGRRVFTAIASHRRIGDPLARFRVRTAHGRRRSVVVVFFLSRYGPYVRQCLVSDRSPGPVLRPAAPSLLSRFSDPTPPRPSVRRLRVRFYPSVVFGLK